MAIKTNFFDGGSGYTAADFINEIKSILADGVFKVKSGSLMVNADAPADLTVNVMPGTAVKNGYFINSDSIIKVQITANTSGYNRIDNIVLDVDTDSKVTTFKAIQGIPSSSPVPSVLTDNQLLLAEIIVGNNVSVLNQNVITDKRISPFRWGNFI